MTTTEPRTTDEGGAKAHRLLALANAGLPVPPLAVIPAGAFARFMDDNGLDERVAEIFDGAGDDDGHRTASEIDALFQTVDLSADAEQLILDAYEQVGGGPVAVRSSATGEDGGSWSFAGQFTTLLNVNGADAVCRAVRTCWASAYSARSMAYRREHSIARDAVRMGVVLQRLVVSDKSGVVFTANPMNGRRDQLVLSAVHGLGEALVSGAVDADTVVVDRVTGAVVERTIGDQTERYDAADGGQGWVVHQVAEADRGRPVLEDREQAAIVGLALRVETLMGAPQDIEWAVADGSVWLLQSRPITSALDDLPVREDDREAAPRLHGDVRVWDNSNIIESFGGVTAPLTFSLASYVYHRVYQEYYRLLGVPHRDIERCDPWMRTMLAYFDGRVYYNLLNWYRMLRPLPLFSINKVMLELSMGVDEPLDDELLADIPGFDHRSPLAQRLLRARIGASYAKYIFTMDAAVAGFLEHFYDAYDRYDALDYAHMSGDDVYRAFLDFEQDILARFGEMLVLEWVIGVTFGALYELTERWMPGAPEWLPWEIAKPDGDVESILPAHELERLAERAAATPAVREIVTNSSTGDAYGALEQAGEREFLAAVDQYIERFGYRNLNELKLEAPDLSEDPSVLFAMLRSALAERASNELGADIESADRYLRKHLVGWRRVPYALLRRRVRRALRARESVRFCRTRAFGVIKKMTRAMGRHLTAVGALTDPSDVFYLQLAELRGCFEGTIPHRDLAALVAMRREQARAAEVLQAPHRFVTIGAPYWGGQLEKAGWRLASDDRSAMAAAPGDVLRGTSCCAGTVEDIVHVVESPGDVRRGVIAAYRTDPGWVTVLPSASALLIERGSPLTHMAIVAREMGVPTIVQVKDLTRRLATGMRVRVDGGAGTIEVVDGPAGPPTA